MLTNKGENWFKEVCLRADYVPDGAQNFEVADFWVSAIRNKIEKKCAEDNKWWPSLRKAHRDVNIGRAFDAVMEEILGDLS